MFCAFPFSAKVNLRTGPFKQCPVYMGRIASSPICVIEFYCTANLIWNKLLLMKIYVRHIGIIDFALRQIV